MILNDIINPTLIAGVGIFLIITLLLVAVLLIAKRFLVKQGDVTITINQKEQVTAPGGASLLSTMASKNVFLPSACGGKGSCGQCKVQVIEGGGEALPTEAVHFSRRQLKEHWRLACQVKVCR
ncbi:MAG: 2Fe-2S iron-sulfur cluster binding domain-containing protein, partial [Muribaculaceae bacterium]|nr:2Fe-2S iron-sulfur cluster binding domain-containing protein [Muribaculaceae bacterium]